jgi:hypothetical protein
MPGRLFPWTALPMLDPTRPSRGTRTTNQSLTWKVASQNVIVITSSLSSYTVSLTNNLAGLEDLDNHLSFLVFFSFMDTAISAFSNRNSLGQRTGRQMDFHCSPVFLWISLSFSLTGEDWNQTTRHSGHSLALLMDFFSRHLGFLLFSYMDTLTAT